nr:LEA_2 domain-containing protein [Ipomoea batatas]
MVLSLLLISIVDSVSLADLDLSFDILRLAVRVNLTLDADVSVKSPNRVGFKYNNSSILLKYRGEDVGDAPIPAKANIHKHCLHHHSSSSSFAHCFPLRNCLSKLAALQIPFTRVGPAAIQILMEISPILDLYSNLRPNTTICTVDRPSTTFLVRLFGKKSQGRRRENAPMSNKLCLREDAGKTYRKWSFDKLVFCVHGLAPRPGFGERAI